MIEKLLHRFIRVGSLTVFHADGHRATYGDGSSPEVTFRLKRGALTRLALNPALAIGECYMDGTLSFEQGGIYDFLEIIGRSLEADPANDRYDGLRRAAFAVARRLGQANDRISARRNVAHHYDLSHELYRRVLDDDLQYSCAYFARPDMTLEEAQAAKKAHLAAKLLLRPGDRVLDVGCGWGGLALSLARHAPLTQVLGITLSAEQLAVAQARAAAQADMAGRLRFELIDYRDVMGPFERIVSVGMFEHVGRPNFSAYFQRIADLLTEDGVAVVHSIGRRREPGVTNPFVAKYIFPGGYIPALSEVLPAIERAGLWLTDLEVLRLHYAETLRAWRERFHAQWDEVAALYDERFCRMWDCYLAMSEIAFRHGGFMVFQLQLSKRVDAVPLTRDYIGQAERARSGAA